MRPHDPHQKDRSVRLSQRRAGAGLKQRHLWLTEDALTCAERLVRHGYARSFGDLVEKLLLTAGGKGVP